MKHHIIFFSFLTLSMSSSLAQGKKCDLVISGNTTTYQAGKETILPYAQIYFENKKRTITSDSLGHFTLNDICEDHVHLHITALGYNPIDTSFTISKNISNIRFLLTPSYNQLQTVTVIGGRTNYDRIEALPNANINGKTLELSRGQLLGEVLKAIPGVTSIQSGPTISKPMIHGVYGNRILILNNGIRQEGQNWGNDHSPEIDPFIASNISVIKGPASLRYGSDAIGGVILVEPAKLPVQSGITGEANLVGMTNSRSGTASAMLQGALDKNLTGLAWRVQGTMQKGGNSKTANYYIPNTGFTQKDFSAAAGYQRHHFGSNVYYSQFRSTVGITPTSEDLTYADFLAAIQRGRPSESLDHFTYKIDPNGARQEIKHELFKANAYWESSSLGKIEATFARQHNNRKEFGLDPLTYTDIPENNFNLTTYNGEVNWIQPEWIHELSGSVGVSYMHQKNTIESRENTEVIPDYHNHTMGVYLIEKYKFNNLLLEGGLRYDHKYQEANLFRRGNALSGTTDSTFDSTANWKKMTANIGASYHFGQHFVLSYNLGTAWRGPSAIELFANGVHQGASRWENGDADLKVESAINNNLTLKYADNHFNIEIGTYANFFKNYIYIKPDGIRQTISGTYPEYQYTQTPKALFTGIDADMTYHLTKHWQFNTKGSIVRGRNRTDDDWLLYVPADRINSSIEYHIEQWKGLKQIFFNINNLTVAHQSRIPDGITEPAPPAAYSLWGFNMGTTFHINKQSIEVSISGSNMLNKEYKDYLNLYRFYNHDLGRNISLHIRVPFSIL